MINLFGDAVMVVFKGNDYLNRSIDCCLAVTQTIHSLSNSDELSVFTPKVSIGVNQGHMACGDLGAECVKRYDYTVIGDVVNTAARLQDVAAPGEIIISEATKKILAQLYEYEDKGVVTLKQTSTIFIH